MALINYVEPINLGSLFEGLSAILFAAVLAYIFYRVYIKLCQLIDIWLNREAKYELIEEAFLDKIGAEKGIDFEKELIKRNMFRQRKKTFRRRIEEQIYQDMFGKDGKEKAK